MYLSLVMWAVSALIASGVITLLYSIYGRMPVAGASALVFGPIPLLVASAWPTRLEVHSDHLVIVNGLVTRRLSRVEVESFEWRRPPQFLTHPFIAARRGSRRSILIAATLTYRESGRLALSRELSRWLADPRLEGIRPGAAYVRDHQVLWVGAALVFGYSIAGEFLTAPIAGVVAIVLGVLTYPIATKVAFFMQQHDVDLGLSAND